MAASLSDHPTAGDGPGTQRDIDVRLKVQGKRLAAGTSVRDKQTRTTVDASDLAIANAAAARRRT